MQGRSTLLHPHLYIRCVIIRAKKEEIEREKNPAIGPYHKKLDRSRARD